MTTRHWSRPCWLLLYWVYLPAPLWRRTSRRWQAAVSTPPRRPSSNTRWRSRLRQSPWSSSAHAAPRRVRGRCHTAVPPLTPSRSQSEHTSAAHVMYECTSGDSKRALVLCIAIRLHRLTHTWDSWHNNYSMIHSRLIWRRIEAKYETEHSLVREKQRRTHENRKFKRTAEYMYIHVRKIVQCHVN